MSYPKVPEKKNPADVLITREADIQAPLETVFDVAVDVELFVELEENVKKVAITSDIKKGKGMKSHWELEHPDTGAAWSVDEEIVHHDRPYQYSYVGFSDGKDYTGTHNLSTNPDGSTHLCFNEVFHFEADEKALGKVIEGMVNNVKRESERRAGQAG